MPGPFFWVLLRRKHWVIIWPATNHILPTGGTARFSSPLGVYDFYKRMSVLSFSRKALKKLGRQTAHFAQMEGLDAHANSVLIRSK